MEKNTLEQKVKEIIAQLRMYVTQDGGDMEFVAIRDRHVYIRLLGNCVGCGLTELTYKEGIESILLEEFPYDIDGVELVM
ncbi:NifU family protein [Spiroplasma culicicola]|uniref:NifU-like domain-containing protein n=1 Tax=Spiroplasma culicicola AES-1 TaxID=1276246 RepID=W6AHG4_9MOLU|nr:NifU family protein [Spiroplasma culicicola]AHI53144.1 NifU-like domain-containing protein [Spiroplasma culicicola AES-1]